jgi:hypothetical protein
MTINMNGETLLIIRGTEMKEEEIRSAIDGVTKETLADALSILLAEENAANETAAVMNKIELVNFAQAVQFLKREYEFAELDLFSTEADLVYVQAGDRRIMLSDRTNGTAKQLSAAENRKHKENNQVLENDQAAEDDGGRFSHLELWK